MMEQKSSLDQTSSESFFFFNPRTPCGVRLNIESSSDEEEEEVSIHALLAECDQWLLSRGYTPTVSIHALLAECDSNFLLLFRRGSGFNPRTPCGVRPIPRSFTPPAKRFQSTHSLRSATRRIMQEQKEQYVSIHALLAECDFPCFVPGIGRLLFQSTHSLRSATP